jgi:anti-anti-sigma factor
MNPLPFQVTSRLVKDVAVVYPRGYLNNLSGEGLVNECGRHARAGVKKVVVNFRETDLINSIGISFLLNVMEELRNAGGMLCFTEMKKVHLDTFEMLGLTKYFLFFPDEDAALKALTGREG